MPIKRRILFHERGSTCCGRRATKPTHAPGQQVCQINVTARRLIEKLALEVWHLAALHPLGTPRKRGREQ